MKHFVTATTLIRMRKVLLISIYDKVSKIPSYSVHNSNSSKIIGTISANIDAAEKDLIYIDQTIASVVSHLVSYVLISLLIDWRFSLIVFTYWIMLLYYAKCLGTSITKNRLSETKLNDRRV